MLLILQIAIGSAVLVFCALLHVVVVVSSIQSLRWVAHFYRPHSIQRAGAVLAATVMMLIFAHTLQIWLWAALFMAMDQFDDLTTSVYFAMVTYTTLGYGDIVLDPYARLIATFAAVTGLITFGISTAVLMGVLGRLLPELFGARGMR